MIREMWRAAVKDQPFTWMAHAYMVAVPPAIVVAAFAVWRPMSDMLVLAAYGIGVLVAGLYYLGVRERMDRLEHLLAGDWDVPSDVVRLAKGAVLSPPSDPDDLLSELRPHLLSARVDRVGDSVGPATGMAVALAGFALVASPAMAFLPLGIATAIVAAHGARTARRTAG